MENTKLIRPVELLSKAFALFKRRWKVFMAIYLIPQLLGLLSAIDTKYDLETGEITLTVIIVGAIALALLIIISLWAEIALIYAVMDKGEKIGFKEAYEMSKDKIIPFLWVSILIFLAIAGGFILLVIPAIIFGLWFGFGIYVLLEQNLRGKAALIKSKEYVQGRLLSVFGRVVFITFIYFVPTIVVIALLNTVTPYSEEVANFVLGFVLGPISTAYSFFLYENLKNTKESSSAVEIAQN